MNYTPLIVTRRKVKPSRVPLQSKYVAGMGIIVLVTLTIGMLVRFGIPKTLGLADVRNDEPVVYWKFDESGATAQDSSSNNNDGSITGATRTSNESCVAGTCLSLDGSNDAVSKSYASDTELNPGTGSFSVSIWFKHPTTNPASAETIIDRYQDAGFRVYMNTSGYMCFGIDDDSTWGPDDSACSTISFADSRWHFLTAVKSGTSSIRLYIDGNQVAEDTSLSATSSLSGSSPGLYVGINSGGGTYNQTISANNRDGTDWTSWDGNSIYAGEWDGTAEIAAWHFSDVDIPQGATIVSATLSVTAESLNNAAPEDVLLEFEAEDIDSASLPSGTNRPSSMTTTTANVDWNLTTWTTNTVYDSPDLSSIVEEVVGRGGWSSGNEINILLGPRTGFTPQADIGIDDYNNGDPASIEIVWTSGSSEVPFEGYVDEFKFYNFAQNQAQIKADYAGPGTALGAGASVGVSSQVRALSNGLVAYYPMNESAANTCAGGTNDTCDRSGNGFDGAWNGNTASTGISRFSLGTTYDGTGDYISVADTASLRPGSGPYTVSFWANPPDSNQTDMLYSKQQTTGDLEQITIGICGAIDCASNGQNLYISFRQSETVERRFLSTADVADGNWHHFTVVVDPNSQQIRAYRDGIELTAGSTVSDGAWPTVDNTDALRIGSDAIASAGYDGELDDLRVYNRVLSPGEITTLYTWAPGPELYWRFDDNTGTTAIDSSGNSFNGVFIGNPSWIPGRYGAALDFDGTDDAVEIDTTAGMLPQSGSMTLMVWARPANSNQNAVLAGRLQGGSPFEQFSMNICGSADCGSSGQLITASIVENSTTTYRNAVTTADIADGNWHHYAMVADRAANTIYIYVDGVRMATTTNSAGSWPTVNNTDVFAAGDYPDSAPFDGPIDEVKYYNYARTPAQIVEDYNGGHPAPGSPISSALVHVKFDETQGTTANNAGSMLTNATGTITNMASPATSTSGWTRNGKLGSALIFDGDNDIVSLGSNSSLDDMTAVTVSAWIYPTGWGESNFGRIIAKENTATAFGFTLVNDSGQNTFRIYRERATTVAQATAASGSISLNTWQHVVGVLDTGTGTIKLYLNGREVGSYIDQGIGAGTPNADAANNMNIGNRTAGDRTFAGTIDDVKIFNSTLTDQQVRMLYNQSAAQVLGAVSTESNGSTPSFATSREYCIPGDTGTCNPPVAEWKFDENTGTSLNDSSGNNNTGTLDGNTSWGRGTLGSAAVFNGTTSDISVAAASTINNLTTLTITGWIQPTSFGESSLGRIVDKGGDTGAGNGYGFMLCDQGFCGSSYTQSLTFSQNFSVTDGVWNSGNDSFTQVSGTWSHVAVTYDKSSSANAPVFYLNGQRTATVAHTSPSGTASDDTSSGMFIGNRSGDDRTFAGSLDTIRIYNYIRTPAQIAWDYNRGAPFAWWKFDECTGSTLNDASGNALNGTITIGASGSYTSTGTCSSGTGTHAWNAGTTGKYSSALGFDGTNDYVSLGNPTALQSFSSLSIAAWINGTYASGDGRVIFSKDTTGFYFGTFDRKVYFRSSDLSSDTTSGTTNLTNGVWTHVAAIYDGANINLYVNGKLEATEAATGTIAENSLTAYIGGFNTTTYLFNGLIDDLRIYSYPITTVQLNTLINEGASNRFGP
jgi:hypothetical protein